MSKKMKCYFRNYDDDYIDFDHETGKLSTNGIRLNKAQTRQLFESMKVYYKVKDNQRKQLTRK